MHDLAHDLAGELGDEIAALGRIGQRGANAGSHDVRRQPPMLVSIASAALLAVMTSISRSVAGRMSIFILK